MDYFQQSFKLIAYAYRCAMAGSEWTILLFQCTWLHDDALVRWWDYFKLHNYFIRYWLVIYGCNYSYNYCTCSSTNVPNFIPICGSQVWYFLSQRFKYFTKPFLQSILIIAMATDAVSLDGNWGKSDWAICENFVFFEAIWLPGCK